MLRGADILLTLIEEPAKEGCRKLIGYVVVKGLNLSVAFSMQRHRSNIEGVTRLVKATKK